MKKRLKLSISKVDNGRYVPYYSYSNPFFYNWELFQSTKTIKTTNTMETTTKRLSFENEFDAEMFCAEIETIEDVEEVLKSLL